MSALTQDDRDEITAVMLGVLERYSGEDGPDLALARELGAACCRIVQKHTPRSDPAISDAADPRGPLPAFAIAAQDLTPLPAARRLWRAGRIAGS